MQNNVNICDSAILAQVYDCLSSPPDVDNAIATLHKLLPTYCCLIIARNRFTTDEQMQTLRNAAEKCYSCETFMGGFVVRKK